MQSRLGGVSACALLVVACWWLGGAPAFAARLDGTALRGDRPLGRTVDYVVSFAEDARGRVYAVSFGGAVYRLAQSM